MKVLALVLSLAIASCGDASSATSVAGSTSVAVGEQGWLHVSGIDTVFVANTRADLDELRKSFIAKDSVGGAQMVVRGAALMVPNDQRVLVIERSGSAIRVRFVDGPQKDVAVWTETEWVLK